MKRSRWICLGFLVVTSLARAQNLYNPAAVSNGFISWYSGAPTQVGDPSYCYPSTPIPVVDGAVYLTSQTLLAGNAGLTFFNSGSYVTGTTNGVPAGGTLIVPTGANQIEFAVACSASSAEAFTFQSSGGSANLGTTATNPTLYNTIFGANNATPIGDHDTVFGVNAGMNLTTAREMTIVGAQACQSYTGAAHPTPWPENGLSTCIGSYAGTAMADPSIDNTFVGQKAGASITTADSEVMVGAHAGIDIFTGSYDTVVGAHTMDGPAGLNSQGVTAIGGFSLNGIGDKDHIVAIGQLTAQALQQSSFDVIIGTNTVSLLHAYDSVLIGDNVGNAGTSVSNSVVIGYDAAPQLPSNSIVIGPYAAPYATAEGTYIGDLAANQVTTGADNVCVGAAACGGLRTGPDNVAVGTLAGSYMNGHETFTVAIGANASTDAGVSNAAQIGQGINSTPNSLQFRQTQVVDTNGDLHAGTSAPGDTDPCAPGAFRIVAPYIYACVAPNQWMRATLTSY